MRFWTLFFLILFAASPVFGNPSIDNALTVRVARGTLLEVMQNIAREINGLKNNFPQLKNWDEAEISPTRIAYRYHYRSGSFGKNGCRLLITSSSRPVWENELKVGVTLKMKAVGGKARLLKEQLLRIIDKEFQKIRNLHNQKVAATPPPVLCPFGTMSLT